MKISEDLMEEIFRFYPARVLEPKTLVGYLLKQPQDFHTIQLLKSKGIKVEYGDTMESVLLELMPKQETKFEMKIEKREPVWAW